MSLPWERSYGALLDLLWLPGPSALHSGWIVVSCQAVLGSSHFLQKLVYLLITLITGYLQDGALPQTPGSSNAQAPWVKQLVFAHHLCTSAIVSLVTRPSAELCKYLLYCLSNNDRGRGKNLSTTDAIVFQILLPRDYWSPSEGAEG